MAVKGSPMLVGPCQQEVSVSHQLEILEVFVFKNGPNPALSVFFVLFTHTIVANIGKDENNIKEAGMSPFKNN